MKHIKKFENFNSWEKSESADEYVKSVLSKLGLKYEEDVHDDDGNLCIKAEFNGDKNGIFYILTSHPNKEDSTYHIQFLVNGQIEDKFSTPDLEGSIKEMIDKLNDDSEMRKNYQGFSLKDDRIKFPREEEAMESRITKKFNEELTVLDEEPWNGLVEDITIGELIEMLEKYDNNAKIGFMYNGDEGFPTIRNGNILEKQGNMYWLNTVYY